MVPEEVVGLEVLVTAQAPTPAKLTPAPAELTESELAVPTEAVEPVATSVKTAQTTGLANPTLRSSSTLRVRERSGRCDAARGEYVERFDVG